MVKASISTMGLRYQFQHSRIVNSAYFVVLIAWKVNFAYKRSSVLYFIILIFGFERSNQIEYAFVIIWIVRWLHSGRTRTIFNLEQFDIYYHHR
jgi:hypothetical protein